MSNALARFVSVSLTVALVACASEEAPTPSAIFVGEIASPETAIAVLAGAEGGTASGQAVVYICDGIGTSAWFFGTIDGDAIAAESDDGGAVQARVAGGQVTGTVDLPGQGPVAFSASRATGVAGLFLVEQTATSAEGFSAVGARVDADITAGAGGSTVSGTVTADGAEPVTLQGTVSAFGESAGVASWIVQANGEVKGRVTNTAGGGNCSVWSKIKSLAFGVDCTFF